MSKPARSASVHFIVEGEFITGIARSLWNDEGEQGPISDCLKMWEVD